MSSPQTHWYLPIFHLCSGATLREQSHVLQPVATFLWPPGTTMVVNGANQAPEPRRVAKVVQMPGRWQRGVMLPYFTDVNLGSR